MQGIRTILLIIVFQLFLDVSAGNAVPRKSELAGYEYLSPLPFTFFHNPETVIIIRFGEKIDTSSIRNELLQVNGDISGKHAGSFSVTSDLLTLIFTPDIIFSYNEKVSLHLCEGIKTIKGGYLPIFDYSFNIRQEYSGIFFQGSDDTENNQLNDKQGNDGLNGRKNNNSSLKGIPGPSVYYSDEVTPGNIMTILKKGLNYYLCLINNNGTLLLANKTQQRSSNFKPHINGMATYFDYGIRGHILIDTFLNPVDTLFMKNGYRPDMHDILFLENGHIIIEAYDPQLVDMSKVTEGGDPNATVTGFVIQELDENRDLVTEWRSWDHFSITDSYENLLSSVVEYVHGNSLDADTDSTLIFSSRNMNEITKINRITGDILWRLGGKNNEFVFRNDNRGFSGQHSAMKQKNGTLTIYDNGNRSDPPFSRGIEYEIDELSKTVTLIKEFRHEPDVFAHVTGNLQRLENGNTFIFWGSILGQTGNIITEYDPTGKLALEVNFDVDTYPTVTAYRTGWDHSIFKLSSDSVTFNDIIPGDSVSMDLDVTNLTGNTINLTSSYGHNRGFQIKDLPISIEALSSKTLSVEFHPESVGNYSDILTVCIETDSTFVARQVEVKGRSILKTGIDNMTFSGFEIYPNPVGSLMEIRSYKMISTIIICDLSGRVIKSVNNTAVSYAVNMESFEKGLYFVIVLFSDKSRSVKRIVKQ